MHKPLRRRLSIRKSRAKSRSKLRASGGVQSIETGVEVLDALADLGPSPMLKTIAERAGMPPAKAHRYLASFERTGLVDREPASGRYRLGPLARKIGLAALHGLEVVRVAAPMMAKIRDDLDETVGLLVWGTHGPTFVWIEEVSSRMVAVTIREGSVLPLLSSASGRVFGAWMPRSVIAPLMDEEIAENRRTKRPNAIVSVRQAEARFAEARRHGVGRTLGEVNPGIHGLSAPILDHHGALAAVLCTLGPAGAIDVSLHGGLAKKLRAAAEEISRGLGFRGIETG